MPTRRIALLLVVAVVMYGSLAVVGGYACRLKSEAYRQACAAALSKRLELPSDIGQVVPRARDRREFRDISVWLPQRRDRALTCDRALVIQRPTENDPDAYEITMIGGACEISTRTWLADDYRGVFESSLRPGFDPDGPRRVRFQDMSLRFEREDFRVMLGQAAGVMDFQSTDAGHASISCNEFNGFPCREPVAISAEFSPQNSGLRLDSISLIVPEIPVELVGLGDLSGGRKIESGAFKGRLTYEEYDRGRRLTAGGSCKDLDLHECTIGLTAIPWEGRCAEIELLELRVENEQPERLHFRGILSDVELGPIAATWGLRGVQGTVNLVVGDADLSPAGVESFIASGGGVDISLEALSRALGWGLMTGDLTIRIDDLTIEDNCVKSLDLELIVADATESPNWIEGQLLREMAKRALNVNLPAFMPERIEYTKLGVKLDVRDEVLYVFGAHGPGESTILTVRMLEQDLPLIFEPRRSFDLKPWLDQVRTRADDMSGRSFRRDSYEP